MKPVQQLLEAPTRIQKQEKCGKNHKHTQNNKSYDGKWQMFGSKIFHVSRQIEICFAIGAVIYVVESSGKCSTVFELHQGSVALIVAFIHRKFLKSK